MMSLFRSRSRAALFLTAVFLLALPAVVYGQTAATAVPRIHERMRSQPMITLPKMLVPSPGAQVTYIITEGAWMETIDLTGFFLWAPIGPDVDENSLLSVRATYTVLSPDPLSGNPRVLVQAQPLNPDSGEPIGKARWETTYIVTDEHAKKESGSNIPDGYSDLVSPTWLTNWTLTAAEDLPQQSLQPGDKWQAFPDFSDWDDFPFGEIVLPLTGEFVGWEELPNTGSAVAHITERASGSESVTEEMSDGVWGNMVYELNGVSDYWLIPGDFPYAAEQSLNGGTRITVGPESGAPAGLEGSAYFTFEFYRSMERDRNGAVTWLEPVDDEVIIGQPVMGTLGPWSEDLGDGTWADFYSFEGVEGDRVEIRLDSADFDAYLFLLTDDEDVVGMDDDSGGLANSLIRFELPYTGTYLLIVNTLFEGETGNYTLSVDRYIFDFDRTLELVSKLQTPEQLFDTELIEVEWGLIELLEQVYLEQWLREYED